MLYLHYFMLTLLPFYLMRERHLSMQSMVRIASAYYSIEAISAIATGWLSDLSIRRGYTPNLVRKSAMAIGHTIAAVGVMTCTLATSQWYLLSLLAIARWWSCRRGDIRVFPDPCRPSCNRKMVGDCKMALQTSRA